MSDRSKTYTAHDVAAAAIALRNAAGVAEEQFPLAQVLGMLADEVRLLQTSGLSGDRIVALLQEAGIRADVGDLHTPEDSASDGPS